MSNNPQAVHNDNKQNCFMLSSKRSVLDYLPVIGSVMAIARITFGIMTVAAGCALAFMPQACRALTKEGSENIARGLIGIIPIIGGLALLAIDLSGRKITNAQVKYV